MVPVASPHDGTFEFVNDGLVELSLLWLLLGVAGTSMGEPLHLLLDEGVAVVDRKILGYVVDNKIQSSLEYPGGGEESWPRLHGVVEYLGL